MVSLHVNKRPLSVIILAGDATSPAFGSLGGRRVLELVLSASGSCRRLLPLSQSIHIVLPSNVADQASTLLQGYGLSSTNVISSQGSGNDVDDLRLALRTMGAKHHVLVVSAHQLAFAPGYNFQRLVEHGLTRNADAVGLQPLGPVELELLGYTGHTVAYTMDSPQLVPRIDSLEFVDSAEEGMWAVQPLLFLTPGTLASGAVEQSRAPGLVGLAKELYGGAGKTPLHGLCLSPGALQLSNPRAIKHAEQCVATLLPLLPSCKPTESDEGVDASQAFTTPTPAHLVATMEKLMVDFNNKFFGLIKASSTDSMPPTFYMTNYRRQAADMLR